MVARYQGRLSGPLLDRIDLQVEVPAVAATTLADAPGGDSSAAMALRVAQARGRALQRQGVLNRELAGESLERHCTLDAAASNFLQSVSVRLGWSARGFHRVLRIARSIADLAGSEAIVLAHVAEAVQYRRVLAVQ